MKPLVLVLAALFTAAPALAQHAVLKASVGTVRVRAIGEKTFDPAAAGAPLLFGDTPADRPGLPGPCPVSRRHGRARQGKRDLESPGRAQEPP